MWAIQSEVGPIHYFWIPNFGDVYAIGDDGSLWSRYQRAGWNWILSNDWIMRHPSPDSNGYLIVVLRYNKVKYTKKIHQLVCEAVYGPCPPGMEVCHNDGDRSNCNWWNLRYDTPVGNASDKVIHGTDSIGENNPNAKLNRVKVREIRVKHATGKYTLTCLALEYGVSAQNIYEIVNNLIWVEDS